MKTTLKKVTILCMAIVLIGSSNLLAQRGRNNVGQGQGQGFDKNVIYNRIPNLTDDQKTKIDALRVDHLKEMNTFRNQLDELRAKKHTLMTSDNSDLKDIYSIIDQMSDLQNKMMKSKAKHHREIRALLTDEQKVYFDSRPMRQRGERGEMSRGGRGFAGAGNPDCPRVNN